MGVEINGFSAARVEDIKTAAEEECPFAGWLEREGELTSSAESSLCGGETEEEFADRLAKAIWTANKAFCLVDVRATYLDDLPCEIHSRDESDYERLLKDEAT
jgi:hypothetical protein